MKKVAFLRLITCPTTIPQLHRRIIPFLPIPLATCVRPEYVIYNAGKKISRHTLELAEQYPEYNANFLQILGMYNSWTEDVPSELLESEANTSASSQTNPGRRKNLWNDDSPTLSPKRQKTRGGWQEEVMSWYMQVHLSSIPISPCTILLYKTPSSCIAAGHPDFRVLPMNIDNTT